MSNSRIMVVDDDEDLRTHLIRALELEKYEVLQAPGGRLALELLGSLPLDRLPGCIVLDLMMPEMDGLEFLDLIKTYPHLKAIPIIVATAKGGEISLPTGVVRLSKPMTLDDLYRVVGECIGSYNHRGA